MLAFALLAGGHRHLDASVEQADHDQPVARVNDLAGAHRRVLGKLAGGQPARAAFACDVFDGAP